MTNLEYLAKVKDADKERYSNDDDRIVTECVYENEGLRKTKALEIIAEELVLAVRELKILTKAVKGKI